MANDLTWVFVSPRGFSSYRRYNGLHARKKLETRTPLCCHRTHHCDCESILRKIFRENQSPYVVFSNVGEHVSDINLKHQQVQSALAAANVVATECVSSIRLVRSFNTENAELAKYSTRILTHFSLMMRQIFYTSGYYMICNTFLINTVVQASILAYGGFLVRENLVSQSTSHSCCTVEFFRIHSEPVQQLYVVIKVLVLWRKYSNTLNVFPSVPEVKRVRHHQK